MWRHWLERLGERHTVVRYDERGCGLSDTESRRSVARGVGRRPRDRRRRGGPGALRAARHLPGRGDRGRLRGTHIRSASPTSSSTAATRAAASSAGGRGGARPRRGDPRRLDGAEPSVPPHVQHCYSFRTARPSRWPGTRICCGAPPRPRTPRRLYRARGDLDVTELAPQVRARTLVCTRATTECPGRGGTAARRTDSGRALGPARVRESHPARRAGVGGVSSRSSTRSSAPARRRPRRRCRRPQRARARGARAGRRADERGDRRPAVPERPDGRATPDEHLREAAGLRESRARRGGRRFAELARTAASRPLTASLRADRHRARASYVQAPMPVAVASTVASRAAQTSRKGDTHGPRFATVPRRFIPSSRSPTHEIRGGRGTRLHAREWGRPGRARLVFVHGWSQCDLVLGEAGAWRRSRSASASSRSTCADTVVSDAPAEAEQYAEGRVWADDWRRSSRPSRAASGTRRLVVRRLIVADYLRAYGEDRIGGSPSSAPP